MRRINSVLLFLLFSQFGFGQLTNPTGKEINFVDSQQQRIDLLDGDNDQSVTLKTVELTKKANQIYFETVDNIQDLIEKAPLEYHVKRNLKDQLVKQLKRVEHRNYAKLNFHGNMLHTIYNGIKAISDGYSKNYMDNNMYNCLSTFAFFKYDGYAHAFLNKVLKKYPTEVLKQHKYFAEMPYAKSVVIETAKVAPNSVKKYLASGGRIAQHLHRSEDYEIETILSIHKNFGNNSKAFALLDGILNSSYTISEADQIGKDKMKYFQALLDIRKRRSINGEYTVNEELTYQSLKFVRVLNDLHLQKNPSIRFKSIEGFTSEELYTLIVYSAEEIFTSTFNGLYSRIKARMKQESGATFLADLGENKFRTFLKLCAGYNKLNDFLATMNDDEQKKLLVKFVSGLEEYGGDLGQAVDVADSFGSITDEKTLEILQEAIAFENYRVNQGDNKEGQAIYGILTSLFIENELFGQDWVSNVSNSYQLPNIDLVPFTELVDESGKNYQIHYFFDDDDGIASFATFLSSFRTSNWEIVDTTIYVIIKSKEGIPVEIYANKPEEEYKGHDLINEVFSEKGIEPHIVVHRGHSYYVPLTIERIPQGAEIVLLGSCGGYHNLTKVLEKSEGVHIISSKQIGTMAVNNPLLKLLAEEINAGDNIIWPEFWATLDGKLKGRISSKSYEQFADYIPPHKNLGAIFVQAYQNIMAM